MVGCERTWPHHCPAAVRDVDRMHQATQGRCRSERARRIGPARRRHLGRQRELTPFQCLAQQRPIPLDPAHHAAAACLQCGFRCASMPERGLPDRAPAHRPLAHHPSQPRSELSERELEIIELVAVGLTNQEIALRLVISKRTVDNHVSNIFTKTGAKNRVALLNWAMDHGKICRDGFNCWSLEGTEPKRQQR